MTFFLPYDIMQADLTNWKMKNFKPCGIRVAESKHGDLHLYDPSLNISLTINSNFFNAGLDEPKYLEDILEKLRAFYNNHRRARIERLKKEVAQLYESGEEGKLNFLKEHKEIIRSLKDTTDELNPRQVTMLRRWEVDLYFFNNPRDERIPTNRSRGADSSS